jgi:hypothetical protein
MAASAAANDNVSVFVVRCFLLYQSCLATVPVHSARLAGQLGGTHRRRADGRAGRLTGTVQLIYVTRHVIAT